MGDCLWDFNNIVDGPNGGAGFHIIGYWLAFSGPDSKLNAVEQNKILGAEPVGNTLGPVSDRVLVADAILSTGYANPGNSYGVVSGGFSAHGKNPYPHTSPHMAGSFPLGSDAGFKDGHVEWHKFGLPTVMTVRAEADRIIGGDLGFLKSVQPSGWTLFLFS